MSTNFSHIAEALTELEQEQFDVIRSSFRWTEDLVPHLSGSIQSYAIDDPKTTERLPVICAVGVNYTQETRVSNELQQYKGVGGPSVIRPTRSTAAVASVLNAYQRNRESWTSRQPQDPPSPLGFYGSPNAMHGIADALQGRFILVMTNVCPFITTIRWGKQPPKVSAQLLEMCRGYDLLDRLHDALGASIDLWIGHSALLGTRWVWPTFASFVKRREIKQWLLTFNINPQSHLWFERTFRKPTHRLFPWYGPEPLALAR